MQHFLISYIKWFRSPPRGKRTDGFYRRESNLWKNQDVWETAKVLGLRNAASKHLAVNQCHPFRRNPSSHFYEDYFLQCIPHSAPSPADKDSRKDHFGKPHRTHGTGAATAGPGTGARVTPGTTVSLPAPDSRFPASVTTFSFSPVPLGESCRNSKGCGGTAAAPIPRSPPQGTPQRPALPLAPGASLLPRSGGDPSRSLRPATARPVRIASISLSLPPSSAPGAAAAADSLRGTGRGATSWRSGGRAAGPSRRPRGHHSGGNPRLSPAAPRRAFPPPRPARRRRRLTRGRTRG